jgi:hypothetical protein
VLANCEADLHAARLVQRADPGRFSVYIDPGTFGTHHVTSATTEIQCEAFGGTFGPFAALLRQHFPAGTQVNLPNDNPFPLLDPASLGGRESLGGVGDCDGTCRGG